MDWKDLTQDEKIEYKNICDKVFGSAPIKVETGQPLYIDSEKHLIDTTPIIILMLRRKKINKLLKKINYEY